MIKYNAFIGPGQAFCLPAPARMTEPMPHAGNSHLTGDSDRTFFTHSHLTEYPLHSTEEQNPKEEEADEGELHQIA
jgi:hypothetical protein